MPTAPIRSVLFVLEYYHPHLGGVELLFRHTAEALARTGTGVTVVTLQVPDAARRETVNGVRIVRVPNVPLVGRYLFALVAIPYAIWFARGVSLIHTTTYSASFPARLAGWLFGTPTVLTVHEVFDRQWQQLPGLAPWLGFCFRAYERLVLALGYDRYLCDSRFTLDRLKRVLKLTDAQAAVIYPAVDYEFWTPDRHRPADLRAAYDLPPSTRLYLYFGRPGVSKGVESLLAAAGTVARLSPDSRLVLILATNPRANYDRLVARVAASGLSGHVILQPSLPREELPAHLLGADLVVIPSVSEGFGYAAVEAASVGCRVLSTQGHSVEEVVGDSIDLVPNHDSAALAAAIVRCLRQPRSATPAPPVYTRERMLAETTRVYRELVPTGA